MAKASASEAQAQYPCSECGEPTPYFGGDGQAYCRKHRPVPPFWSSEHVRLVLLGMYYGLLNENPAFLADLVVLLEDAALATTSPARLGSTLQASMERFARRWGIPLAHVAEDLRHSASLLQWVMAAHPDDPAYLAEYRKLTTGTRGWWPPDLRGHIVSPAPFPPLAYDPSEQSPRHIREQVNALAQAFERQLIDQVEAIEERARNAGYENSLKRRKRTPAEMDAMVRRANSWWALNLTEAEIARRESVEIDTIHKSIQQWRRYFPSVPRRPRTGKDSSQP